MKKFLLAIFIIFLFVLLINQQSNIIVDKIYEPPDKYYIKLNNKPEPILVERTLWKSYGVGEQYKTD